MTVQPEALATSARIFDRLAVETADDPGVTRPSFGPGEQLAHDLVREEGERLGLEISVDPIGNLYLTLPGRDRDAPCVMIGSHCDSVAHGGNFDGLAGVLAGLAVVEDLVMRGAKPAVDVTVMAIRSEEMVWFPAHYIGSRMAFGILPQDAPDTLRRSDTAQTLAVHMAEAGFDPDFVRAGRASLDPAKIGAFIEPHIEQGPVLVERGLPVGIVTAIRGNVRYRFASIVGQTTHAGGVPRASRRDAVLAGAELAARLEAQWIAREAAGEDLVLTMGQFATDAARHGITKVPGRVDFTLDFRSVDGAVLAGLDAELGAMAAEIATARGVVIELGSSTRGPEAAMDEDIRAHLHAAAAVSGIAVGDIASGGGHDCAVFTEQGIPSAMVFIRNENGSHNPDEAMELGDFAAAVQVLAGAVDRLVGTG